MGEAKRRGTFEQRKAEGEVERNKESLRRQEEFKKRWNRMSKDERQKLVLTMSLGAQR